MLRQILFAVFIVVTACTQTPQDTGLFAPDIDPSGKQVDAMVVGERLMDAGEYELALDAFTRAAASDGFTGENLSAMGVANFRLGRMDQALAMFERALKIEPEWPGLLNNYGIALMAKGRFADAVQIFTKAVALDNGQNDSIRKNLAEAVEKYENSVYSAQDNETERMPQGIKIISDEQFP